MRPLPDERPPNVTKLVAILAQYEVRYVLIGSVAAQMYGADVQPGDFDITPALDFENLSRLSAVLLEIGAALGEGPGGHWALQADGEKKWVEEPVDDEVLVARRAWKPDPNDIASMDHLFLSRYGNFDVVPELCGTHEFLMERAVAQEVDGHTIRVAHVDDLLAALTVPRRQKDAGRVRQLRRVQRQWKR